MATVDAIARKRALALERLKVAAAVIGAAHDVPPPDIPLGGHDPLAVQANQLEVLATWAESIAWKISPPVEVLDEAPTEDTPPTEPTEEAEQLAVVTEITEPPIKEDDTNKFPLNPKRKHNPNQRA